MHLHRPPRLHAAMADELSQELIAEFSQGFKYFDRDEDGRVSTNQLGTLMRSLGQNPTEAELQEMVNGFDLEGKGTMDLEEFLALMVKQRARMATERQLIEMFEVFDPEKTRKISLAHWRHAMTHMGEKLSEDEVDEMILDAEVDDNGKIDYEAYVLKMMSIDAPRVEPPRRWM